MASRDLELLNDEMCLRVLRTIESCKRQGVEILVYCTVRGLHEQARLFRKTRRIQQIEQKIEDLKNKGFWYLAQVIVDVGPQEGRVGPPHLTYAGPGESFHQYGLAVDAVPIVDGKAQWVDPDETVDEWEIYHDTAKRNGLVALSFEKPHVQMMNQHSRALEVYSESFVHRMFTRVDAWEKDGTL